MKVCLPTWLPRLGRKMLRTQPIDEVVAQYRRHSTAASDEAATYLAQHCTGILVTTACQCDNPLCLYVMVNDRSSIRVPKHWDPERVLTFRELLIVLADLVDGHRSHGTRGQDG